eukprot:CAMPEP_0184652298 /NCGR_PEP_ID=MMETSP0308-20130426/9998_1 /TAXON_ID=38269 /ORGANISM="Gloeochaete witrockiana, Strain SAG 46.84" /LENGTH=680 /DNA_ID=CAMNT_0027087099 /DNA_START=276 /DNA_END=2315 /DNA_ORIENTATION=+
MNKPKSLLLNLVPNLPLESFRTAEVHNTSKWTLRFKNRAVEKGYCDWTMNTTWTRCLLMAALMFLIIVASVSYILQSVQQDSIPSLLPPMAIILGLSAFDLGFHLLATFYPKLRSFARWFGYIYFSYWIIYAQWLFCFKYQDPYAYFAVHQFVFGCLYLGPRYRLLEMFPVLVTSSVSFVVVYGTTSLRHTFAPFGEVAVLFAIGHMFLLCSTTWDQERFLRDDYLRSIAMEKSLAASAAENQQLRMENELLKTGRRNPNLELSTPLENILDKLKELMEDNVSVSTSDTVWHDKLEFVLKTLSSATNIRQPFISAEAQSGNMDSATSQWLMNEVNVRAVDKEGKSLRRSRSRRISRSWTFKASNIRAPPTPDPNFVEQFSSRPGEIITKEIEDALEGPMQNICEWDDFDLEGVVRISKGRPLYCVSMALLTELDIFSAFRLDVDRLSNFLQAVEDGYKPGVPYHNAVHAADVAQAVGSLLKTTTARHYLSNLDVLGCILAAIIHDLGHEGVNNSYEIFTESDRAMIYNDRSVMENYHLSRAFTLLKKEENDFLCNCSVEDRRDLRKIIIACVMATDLSQHFEHVGLFKARAASDGFGSPEGKQVLMNMLIKVADISNAGRKKDVYMPWVDKIMEEFFRQGDQEREKGLDISPWMDRKDPQVKLCQIGFLDYLALPTYKAW